MNKILIILFVGIIVYLVYTKRECFTAVSSQEKTCQPRNQLKIHNAKALVVTCMDFRLIDDAVYYLNKIGYNNNYDQFILAGSTLGYNQDKFSEWVKTLDKHIELAKQLHQIDEIIFIDHMGCGAYKIFYNNPDLKEKDELELHKINFNKIKETMKNKYPEIKIKTLLMDLNGNIINL
jgi:carbonic anhydrase